MKTIPSSPILTAWLSRHQKFAALAKREAFTFEDDIFEKAAHIVAAHHPSMNQAGVEIRAALQLLMGGHSGEAKEAEPEQEMIVDSLEVRLPSWVKKWAILVAILLTVIAFAVVAKAEPGNAVPASQVLAAFHSNPGVLAQFGGIVIQLQNGGSTLATRGGGLVIFNCTGSGLSCSFSGSTFTMNGSGGGGTGCVPPGTTSDAILYDSGSGACSDVSKWTTNGTTTITAAATAIFDARLATSLYVPSSGGCAPTTSALACYDSTNHIWVFGNNGSTQTMCNTQGGTAGQVFESVGGTACGGYADPLVSGTDAIGAAPTKNPLFMATWDGTDIRVPLTTNTTPGSSDYALEVRNIPSGTQGVSGTFWQATQPVSGTFWQTTQPVSIASMPSTPVTGTFWQSTQPVSGTFWQSTQPVSIASMPSTPVTGTFWQSTQPVSGTFWQTTQPASCTLANCANQTAGLPESASTYAASSYEVDALTTAAAVKASAGNVYGWYVYNPNASTCFLEVFNTASPTLGTTAPILSLGIPATSAANIPPGAIAVANFSTAIEVAATTASKGSSTCGTGMTVNLWFN